MEGNQLKHLLLSDSLDLHFHIVHLMILKPTQNIVAISLLFKDHQAVLIDVINIYKLLSLKEATVQNVFQKRCPHILRCRNELHNSNIQVYVCRTKFWKREFFLQAEHTVLREKCYVV